MPNREWTVIYVQIIITIFGIAILIVLVFHLQQKLVQNVTFNRFTLPQIYWNVDQLPVYNLT